VSGVDAARREVIAEGRRIPFDHLILATGAQHAYFGHDDWAGVRARPEDHRRRDLHSPPHPARLRESRDRG
jgi:NADPH-dependent 2,4-dienoyl-CoA reductase/sulfur reductase-like enzyme